jgi:flagellar motor switch protein FliN/FliY
MTTNIPANKANPSFSKALFKALVGTLTDSSGSLWMIAEAPDDDPTPDASEAVRTKLTLDGGLRGEVLLECGRPAATLLVSKFLRQPVGQFGIEQSEALLKLIEAGMSQFCAILAQEYGKVTVTVNSVSEPASDSASVNQITIADDDANRVSILMYLSPPLTESLSLHSKDHQTLPGAGTEVKGAVGDSISVPVNLNLVMDVELNVTLRFGQRQLTLREMLELTTGSVVELDRQVEEPVELILEGKVIARGEAVVIDGNYGLRVTEVSQPIFSPTTR